MNIMVSGFELRLINKKVGPNQPTDFEQNHLKDFKNQSPVKLVNGTPKNSNIALAIPGILQLLNHLEELGI
ncbi:hypothetical protein BpHYR1_011867 [Brachionus plicatilis]|uniref:Uncharacterized protein n=1 Tax=Brachionus plicatilis TaxID=10195 RepID=A0A3M7SY38_BRAPC|nr:hypothetical protein BpHYR1_011867 [Brachionus plicatilis]